MGRETPPDDAVHDPLDGPTPDPRIGAHIGNYALHERLGKGGMALVYRATHLKFHEPAAVKLLNARHGADPEMRRRFLREARAMREISKRNRHVVRALDYGETPDGEVYLVMEYLRGQDLAQVVRATGPLDWARLAPIALQLCDALAATHAAGLIHRDIKPSNCFLAEVAAARPHTRPGPVVKLIDFGVAKHLGGSGEQTAQGVVLGTPAYIAPEMLALAAPPDVRTDVYALGATLYALLTGAPPYTGKRPSELVYKQYHEVLPPPSARRPAELPRLAPEVDALVLRALARDPEKRFQSATEFADAIHATVRHDSEPATVIHVRTPPAAAVATASPDLLVRMLAIVTVLVAAAVAGIAWLVFNPPALSTTPAPGTCDVTRDDDDCPDDQWCIRGTCRPRPQIEYAARGESCRERDCEPPHLDCGPDLVCYRRAGERPVAPHCEDPRVVAAVESLVAKCNQRQHDIASLAEDPMNCSGDVWRDLTASDAEIDLLLSAFPDRFAIAFPRGQPKLRSGWPDADTEAFLAAQLGPHLPRLAQAHRIFVIGRASPDGPADHNYALTLRRIDVFVRMFKRMLRAGAPQGPQQPDPVFVSWGVADDRLLTLSSFTRHYVGEHDPFAFSAAEQTPLRAGVDAFMRGEQLPDRELRTLEQAVNRVVLVVPILCDPRKLPP